MRFKFLKRTSDLRMESNRFLCMRLFVFVNKHSMLIYIEWMEKVLCFWHWDIWRDMHLLKNLCSQKRMCYLSIVNHSCPLLQISPISLEEEGISETPSLKKGSARRKAFSIKLRHSLVKLILMPIYSSCALKSIYLNWNVERNSLIRKAQKCGKVQMLESNPIFPFTIFIPKRISL